MAVPPPTSYHKYCIYCDHTIMWGKALRWTNRPTLDLFSLDLFGAGEMPQWVKCLLGKPDDLKLAPRHPCKDVGVATSCNPSTD